jgi:hypothetical protein
LVILLMPLLVAFVPKIPSASLPPSAVHRLVIWDFAAARIAEKPITGWGLEASRAMPGGRALPDAATLDRLNIANPAQREALALPHVEVMPLHPHNGALQLWLELGGIGALIGAALMLALGVAASRSAAPAAGAGMLASAAVTGMLSFGLWQAWWVASLLLAMVALDGEPRFTNIWAYPNLNARSQLRADAVAQGIWPPKGGPAHLSTRMVSTIALPTAVSPMK